MSLSVGTDIIEIGRIAALLERWPEKFGKKLFTDEENCYCLSRRNQAQHFAARFAAKEALFKALRLKRGCGVALREIEVKNDSKGAPRYELSGKAALLARERKVISISLSLSHCREYATAVAIVEYE